VVGEVLYGRLEEEIEKTRQSMVSIGLKYGLTHSETVILSKKLDELLNKLSLYKH
jgi:hypothetical protein